jgi:hypothetical protein
MGLRSVEPLLVTWLVETGEVGAKRSERAGGRGGIALLGRYRSMTSEQCVGSVEVFHSSSSLRTGRCNNRQSPREGA